MLLTDDVLDVVLDVVVLDVVVLLLCVVQERTLIRS